MGTDSDLVEECGIPADIVAQSLFLLCDEAWLVAAPLTPASARWWGSFTEWCTAREAASFWWYQERGPLIVFYSRSEGHSWQLHPATGEFRDGRNKMVSWRGFVGRNPAVLGAMIGVLARALPLAKVEGNLIQNQCHSDSG